MTNIKLILTDLDETLLHSDKTISDYSAKIFAECQKKGILVGFCTSRGKPNTDEFVGKIIPEIIICNGGACIYYKNELLHCASFSFEETKSILQTAYKVCGEDCEITVDTIDKIYWNKMNDKSTQYSDISLYDDFKDFSKFTECAMKICVQTDDVQKAKLISQSVPSCDYLPFSDIPWFKFSSSTATKEHSIKVLSEKIQIPLEQIIAFGDDFNDIGMLKLCGTGVAMKNAIPQVKEVADFETLSNNEDGVAKYIEENIL